MEASVTLGGREGGRKGEGREGEGGGAREEEEDGAGRDGGGGGGGRGERETPQWGPIAAVPLIPG